MSWLTFVLLALVLIFAVQGFRKGMLRICRASGFMVIISKPQAEISLRMFSLDISVSKPSSMCTASMRKPHL